MIFRNIFGRCSAIIIVVPSCLATPYVLVKDYSLSTFFDDFNFFTGGDPTHGYVQYVNRSYAQNAGLIGTYSDHVYVGVDYTNKYNPNGGGRPSVRISSTQTYTHGLFILELAHMPYGCGTWPAFWTLGPDWPTNGEIDIIEGVNTNTENLMSLHTSNNCTTAGVNETGTLLTSNCYEAVNSNSGCGVSSKNYYSYGSAFNSEGGGIYAMEWTSQYIRTWFFKRSSVPTSIVSGTPDTSTFGTPDANFEGGCNIDAHFASHSIIFDVTFCGDYAGYTYPSTCPQTAGASVYQSCIDWVADNPSNFSEAYWSIESLKVYQQQNGGSFSTSSVSISSSTPVAGSTPPTSLSSAGMGVGTTGISSLKTTTLSLPSSVSTSHHTTASSMHSTQTSSSIRRSTATTMTSLNKTTTTTISTTKSTTTVKPTSAKKTSSTKKVASTRKVLSTTKTSSHKTTSHKATTTAHRTQQLALTRDHPWCRSIFEQSTNVFDRVYCNARILGNIVTEVLASSFKDCISKCNLSSAKCEAVVWNNATRPAICTLKQLDGQGKNRASARLIYQKGIYAALRVADQAAASAAPADPVPVHTTTASPNNAKSIQHHSLTRKKHMHHHTCKHKVNTRTITTTKYPRPKTTSYSTFTSHGIAFVSTVYLCYTCALTPTVMHTAMALHSPSPGPKTAILRGTNPPPNANACTSGTHYSNSFGMQYAITCNTSLTSPLLLTTHRPSFSTCLSTCDTHNYRYFYNSSASCAGVTYLSNAEKNCQLHSLGANAGADGDAGAVTTRPSPNALSAQLQTGISRNCVVTETIYAHEVGRTAPKPSKAKASASVKTKTKITTKPTSHAKQSFPERTVTKTITKTTTAHPLRTTTKVINRTRTRTRVTTRVRTTVQELTVTVTRTPTSSRRASSCRTAATHFAPQASARAVSAKAGREEGMRRSVFEGVVGLEGLLGTKDGMETGTWGLAVVDGRGVFLEGPAVG